MASSSGPEGMERKLQLTPEKCVQLQVAYGADMVMCLDDCTHVDDPPEVQELSVRRTIAWAKRCRTEFDRLLAQKKARGPRPLLFAVVQGGGSEELRTRVRRGAAGDRLRRLRLRRLAARRRGQPGDTRCWTLTRR